MFLLPSHLLQVLHRRPLVRVAGLHGCAVLLHQLPMLGIGQLLLASEVLHHAGVAAHVALRRSARRLLRRHRRAQIVHLLGELGDARGVALHLLAARQDPAPFLLEPAVLVLRAHQLAERVHRVPHQALRHRLRVSPHAGHELSPLHTLGGGLPDELRHGLRHCLQVHPPPYAHRVPLRKLGPVHARAGVRRSLHVVPLLLLLFL
mmetsp:Transcript_34354/g.65640  ORF Transcript_34354/g.65640 Transcript_34354/m.65640 type:complete len:205 (+) Transcript_34354:1972-2586(+)